jgi:Sigma-54 interaction domain
MLRTKTATTDRPFLIAGESGTGGELAVCALREVSDRPPRALASANCAATLPPPPDNPWFVRLADWPSTPRTQSRSGGSRSADGGTIFSEGVDEFAAKFHSNPRLGLEAGDAEPQSEPRVALWMRSGNPTLRAATMDGKAGQKHLKIEPEKIEPAEAADELNFPGRQQVPESERIALDTARPLLVWTLWTNPLSRYLPG